jgi:hypothetical protein
MAWVLLLNMITKKCRDQLTKDELEVQPFVFLGQCLPRLKEAHSAIELRRAIGSSNWKLMRKCICLRHNGVIEGKLAKVQAFSLF